MLHLNTTKCVSGDSFEYVMIIKFSHWPNGLENIGYKVYMARGMRLDVEKMKIWFEVNIHCQIKLSIDTGGLWKTSAQVLLLLKL